ncbi:hypothetical protein IHN63_00460 [Deinococcus sp. 6YEL10]|uniref:hypothetical protein n=1 Tax=Deinococcus sp. 6YEL10 TaxID=2745870 RepID=UPI001E556A18|nr:hypothetical protein [Deinococcus sp. 6YEL10]MCD0159771.1 hypothetical protein [Deinococcus sp. 6YEL10]
MITSVTGGAAAPPTGSAIRFRMQLLTQDGSNSEVFEFDRLPQRFTYSHSNLISEQVAPGMPDPIIQFIGGSSTEFSVTARVLDVVNDRDKVVQRANERVKRLKNLLEPRKGQWASVPIFALSGIDTALFGGSIVVVERFEIEPHLGHIMNIDDPGKMRVGDWMVTMSFKRASSLVLGKPVGPAMR